MGLIDGVKRILGTPKQPRVPATEFAISLATAIDVVGKYGNTLGKRSPEDGIGLLQSELRLPHSKETISRSIAFLKSTLDSESGRAMAVKSLSPEEAQYFLSAKSAESLNAGAENLDYYVPDEQLHQQRKLVEDMLPLIDSLDSNAREELLSAGNLREAVEAARARLRH